MEDDIGYKCGVCKEIRPEEKVEMEEHPNPSLGKFPVCIDQPCDVEDINDPTESDYKITDNLE